MLEKLKQWFNNIQTTIENTLQKDKLEHFFVGFLLSCVGLIIFKFVLINPLIILLIPMTVAIIKELIDKYVRGGIFSLLDILFTTLPGLILYIIIII